MYLIAGLGNPEKKYDNTRHNVGFDAIDVLSKRYLIPVMTNKFKAMVGRGEIEGLDVILMKPLTYMNLSGEAIREAADFYKIPPENIVILCDDVYLDIGVLRVRGNGSAGGHNGLKNIIQHLGGGVFPRVRIGVGKQPEGMDLVKFVLSHFTLRERAVLNMSIEDAASAAVSVFKNGVDKTMNLYNGKRNE